MNENETLGQERKVFYINVEQLSPSEAESLIKKIREANSVEGRWQAPPTDESVWIPIRPLRKDEEEVIQNKIQKLQELKLQIMSQNPQLLGITIPEMQTIDTTTESYTIIADLTKKLETQRDEFDKALEFGYEEAWKIICDLREEIKDLKKKLAKYEK